MSLDLSVLMNKRISSQMKKSVEIFLKIHGFYKDEHGLSETSFSGLVSRERSRGLREGFMWGRSF